MKKLILLMILGVVTSTGFAQTFEQPKDGAKIYLSTNELEMNMSSEAKVDIWVVRSKRAMKANFDAPKFLGASDMGISIEADSNDPNHFVATLNSAGTKNGKYFYTVSSRSRSSQKVIGSTISVVVGSVEAVSKND
ncbi:MAG: hypothetical protein ABJG78_09040 [Cyclobacteriaceae bacterium]